MVIRSATPEDIDRCCELLAILFEQETEFEPDPELQKKGLQMIIENPSFGTILVCENSNDGYITGMLVLLFSVSTALGMKVALLEDMIVDPDFRSRGIGNHLIQNAVRFAETEGFGRITLLTDAGNGRAHDFYKKNGFTRSGMVMFRKNISPSR